MPHHLDIFKNRIAEVEEWLRKELMMLRTGRATTAILDAIQVESYGSWMPIAHVANISTEDARTIRIAPWDKTQGKAIEAAIQKADIGLSVTVDDAGLRVIFPELTGERRAQIIKLLNQKHEEARVSLRKLREEQLNEWKQMEKDGDMSEDEHFKAREALQKLIDTANARLEDMAGKKEKEISS